MFRLILFYFSNVSQLLKPLQPVYNMCDIVHINMCIIKYFIMIRVLRITDSFVNQLLMCFVVQLFKRILLEFSHGIMFEEETKV